MEPDDIDMPDAEVPAAVQEACASWVARLFHRTTRHPALLSASEAPSGGTATASTYAPPDAMPPAVRGLLAPFRRQVV